MSTRYCKGKRQGKLRCKLLGSTSPRLFESKEQQIGENQVDVCPNMSRAAQENRSPKQASKALLGSQCRGGTLVHKAGDLKDVIHEFTAHDEDTAL